MSEPTPKDKFLLAAGELADADGPDALLSALIGAAVVTMMADNTGNASVFAAFGGFVTLMSEAVMIVVNEGSTEGGENAEAAQN